MLSLKTADVDFLPGEEPLVHDSLKVHQPGAQAKPKPDFEFGKQAAKGENVGLRKGPQPISDTRRKGSEAKASTRSCLGTKDPSSVSTLGGRRKGGAEPKEAAGRPTR
jgi:hypothetical protein